MTERTATKRAIKALGGPTKAASELKVTRARIYQWFDHGFPEQRAYQLATLSGEPLDDLLREASVQ